ncbi:hypothetical protein [Streptomyces sp. NBC_00249]|uniref:hypothetical protein n=1 Tax=Streptomyces sp. NBC_00249 TaxID=2975690 RepID=UPI002B1DF805|nr:hypothetical protein [Streptomyces sp. NBC_00249]
MTSNPSTPETDGPKTETTLTTRIRINIPGSRPIPPVVVRKAVKDAAEGSPPGQVAPAAPAGSAPAPAPAPASARAALPARPSAAQPPAAPAPAAEEPAGNWFAPRKATPPPAPSAPAPPSAGYGSSAPPAPRAPSAPAPGSGAGFAPPVAPGHPQAPGAHGTGAGFAPPPVGGVLGGPGVGAPPGGGRAPGYAEYDNGPATEAFPAFPESGYPDPAFADAFAAPAGPTGGPALGTVPVGAEEPARWPGPEAPSVPGGPMAVPPPGPQAPKPPRPLPVPPPAPAGKGSKQAKGAKAGKSGKAAKPAKSAKKGRSKLVLLGGGIFALAGLAYGAGLLMNHSDVPKGTKVLGVDISGSRDDAVTKLQDAFGTRAAAPLPLTVGGKQVELKPDKAGLTLDSQTTVRNAAGSDYNPVTVIGSLFGVERTALAVMPVDEEKLRVALQELAGTAGSATEGTVKFDTGKAVAVPGKAGTSLDVDGSIDQVTKAFRELVASGKAPAVELPTATKEPTVTQAELDRAMKEFAEPAMSSPATVKAGGKSLPFGSKSLPKILSMQAIDGKLVEKYDLEALKATYGNAFDGVLITRGTGAKTPVTPQDVAGALGKALVGKTPAERIVTIDTNAS